MKTIKGDIYDVFFEHDSNKACIVFLEHQFKKGNKGVFYWEYCCDKGYSDSKDLALIILKKQICNPFKEYCLFKVDYKIFCKKCNTMLRFEKNVPLSRAKEIFKYKSFESYFRL